MILNDLSNIFSVVTQRLENFLRAFEKSFGPKRYIDPLSESVWHMLQEGIFLSQNFFSPPRQSRPKGGLRKILCSQVWYGQNSIFNPQTIHGNNFWHNDMYEIQILTTFCKQKRYFLVSWRNIWVNW